jgi:sulfur-oxidizing protein SoxB
MLSRRDVLQVALATGALLGQGRLASLAAQQRISEQDLLSFRPKGGLTLLHMADCHAQLVPHHFREPAENIGVGGLADIPPHVTGAAYLSTFGIAPGSHLQYALTDQDYVALARTYGRVGGMDRVARIIGAIREERGAGNVLFLDGGDTLQGSYTAMASKGADMAAVLDALAVDATTGHWEFTLGHDRVVELFGDRQASGTVKAAFLAGNVRETDFDEPVFHSTRHFERGGTRVAVIGQAFPFTPIAHPRRMMPQWSFGIREDDVRKAVAAARAAGAEVVVLLSHNGFDVDRKMASRVADIDVILTAHTHDALPVPVTVGSTLLVASGSHAKFVSRLDLDVRGGRIVDHAYSLIPVLADAIAPDARMAALISSIRAPHEAMLKQELARSETLLFRRGTFNGTMDDLICEALMSQRDAEIALSPGFRWGTSVLPGDAITWDDVYNATAISYPTAYRTTMTGQTLKDILEDVADNLFNVDPYYQQGGDMVRVGGLGLSVHVDRPMGQRIADLTLLRTRAPIDPSSRYVVAGWGSIADGVEGPPIWNVVAAHLSKRGSIAQSPASAIRIVRG